MELPAGTQTTVVGATAGAAVGVAAEYFVAQRAATFQSTVHLN